MLARHRKIRPWRAVAYFLLALGGIVIWLDPSRNVQPVPDGLRWVWASFIVVGGLASSYGAIRDKWLYEFVSLPLLMMGFTAYVVVLCAGVGTGRLAFAAWLASIVVQTARRWAGLWRFVTALKRANRRQEDRDA
jgi:hypothetical protein